MSTQSQQTKREQYEEGFLDQNTWIRPLAVFVLICFGLLALIITSNATMGWLGGRFGQVLFGMIASLIFMSFIISAILLVVNGARYLME
ncbi:hypothetical protein G9C85_05385 [Halorubellus sp. JP-L1]|uniref:hypothetical protein n=1 Tax=Halorubellus sp. JP-L1 TaxID=2715753 RepID=UPI00140A81BA|nr:hypothetical protein [Halorubellus sp. JP-L1]NHN41069.1 hypothetical protein [Halorubellus sp. JP-L1]